MNSLTVIILTKNEEKHIYRCITNLFRVASEIFVIDSYSSDSTCKIAESLGAKVYKNEWVNYSSQFNWALENCPINTSWIMRMDCDEYLTDNLIEEINFKLKDSKSDVSGYLINRRVMFMNRWIKFGGYYPTYLLRIWRTGHGKIECRAMDEHILLEKGEIELLDNDLVDHNLNGLSWWIEKHNNYATREMHDMVAIATHTKAKENLSLELYGKQYNRKRWLKEKVYSNIPLFVRPLCYYIYRYIFLLGFLDGRPGLIFHFLQGFWYRFLVDAKLEELRLKSQQK